MLNYAQIAKSIRCEIVDMIHSSHASHIASAMSIVDILTVLYGEVMNISPANYDDNNRDFFVLSKGHAASAVYACLHKFGFLTDDEISKYYTNGSYLSGHVSHKGVKGIEISTGSLGHGACIACGIATAEKLDKTNNKVYTIVGDGECNEGSIWEMAMFASQRNLDNFTVIVDKNNLQAMGHTKDIINCDYLADKWRSFGFDVIEIDGHEYSSIQSALLAVSTRPKCIIANTVKGKGVSFMENNNLWHYRDPQGEFYDRAKADIEREHNA